MRYAKITDGVLKLMPQSIIIDNMEVINPKPEQALSHGWYPFDETVPSITPTKWYHMEVSPQIVDGVVKQVGIAVKDAQPLRNDLIVSKIRETYTIDAEIAINRQRDAKPDEFTAYFEVCEAAKTWADAQLAEWEEA